MSQADRLRKAVDRLNKELGKLTFQEPVTHVLNPLTYAHKPADVYLERYLCGPPGRTLLLGMNPGPWGMAQTGVPFGEIGAVRDWLGIEEPVSKPSDEHPKRPVEGFECSRSEVSGRRLWGLFSDRFPDPEKFAEQYLVFNYCPLIFLEESGRNRTPDRLPKREREPLFERCDRCLTTLIKELRIVKALGIGKFAERRLKAVKESAGLLEVDSILHPSPANPAANRGWEEAVRPQLGL